MRALVQALNPWQQSGNTAATPTTAGFTLVEMMVTVAIIAILSAIAVGRYDALKVMAHRGEAKSNLGMMSKLQEVYRVEHDNYYDASNATTQLNSALAYQATSASSCSGGTCTGAETTSAACTTCGGSWTASTGNCSGNALGFKIKDCNSGGNIRYKYYFDTSDTTGYVAVAQGVDGAVSCNTSGVTAGSPTKQLPAAAYTVGGADSSARTLGSHDNDVLYQTDRGQTGLGADVLGCRD